MEIESMKLTTLDEFRKVCEQWADDRLKTVRFKNKRVSKKGKDLGQILNELLKKNITKFSEAYGLLERGQILNAIIPGRNENADLLIIPLKLEGDDLYSWLTDKWEIMHFIPSYVFKCKNFQVRRMTVEKEHALREALHNVKIGYEDTCLGTRVTRWDKDHYTVGDFSESIVNEESAIEILGVKPVTLTEAKRIERLTCGYNDVVKKKMGKGYEEA